MSALHTRGPWAVKFRDDGSSYICMGGIENGQQHKQFDLLLFKGEGNDEDDARLIAAAPDMLEALQNLMRHMPDYADTVWIDAQEVIARATGAKP